VARIVAGVDQSPSARRALAWATQEAGLRQAVLQMVHAYHTKESAAPFYFPSQHALPATTVGRAGEPAPEELAASMGDHAEFEQAYRGQAEEFLQGLLDELQEPLRGVQVQPTVVADQHPAEALVDLSADAELLVGRITRPWGLRRAAARVGQPCGGVARGLPGGRSPIPAGRASDPTTAIPAAHWDDVGRATSR
jgi:nucleotide-binding universal stress UspA family protein